MTNNIYFIANWKMHGITSSLSSLNRLINLKKLKKYDKAKIIYFPPFTLMKDFVKKFNKTKIFVPQDLKVQKIKNKKRQIVYKSPFYF